MRFEEHVRRALDSLPPDLARGLENVAVVVEDENRDDPDLFGLFEELPYMPAKVTIYRLPLVESFPEPAELAREHAELEEQIARLWDEQRALRAQARFGDRDAIIKRARAEERLERAA